MYQNMASKIFRVIEIICVSIFCTALLIYGIIFIAVSNQLLITGVYLTFAVICVLVTFLFRNFLLKQDSKTRILYIIALAFLIRALASYFINLTQQGDYGIYVSAAKSISEGTFTPSLYYGVFPHALNYPIFLSSLYKIFGETTWLPRATTILFELIEIGFATAVAEKSIGPKFGLLAGLCLTLSPSMILFSTVGGGECIYGALIMAALFFIIYSGEYSFARNIIMSIAAGLISAAANFFRPTGIIFIIAVLIQIFIFEKGKLKPKLIRFGSFACSFVAAAFIFSLITMSVSGYKTPHKSYGWNLYIGANIESHGHWNDKDGQLFLKTLKENDDPTKIQTYFYNMGIQRYAQMKWYMPVHFYDKLLLWFDESFVTDAISKWQGEYTRFQSANAADTYFLIDYYINVFVMLLAALAMAAIALKKSVPAGLKTASLYLMGNIAMFLILESASRYKGAYYGVITLLSSYGLLMIYRTVRRLKTKFDLSISA